MRLIVWTILRRAGRHKIKRLATDTMHVKSQKVRNWKPQSQTPTRTLQLTGISSKHRGTRSNLCSYVYEPCLPEAMQKRILSRTWLKETVIAVPEAILCLWAFKKCAQKCVETHAFKSLFCRKWFKHIHVQPNQYNMPSTSPQGIEGRRRGGEEGRCKQL